MSLDMGALASACPDRDALAAFNHGRLPAELLEVIAEHVSGCSRCASSLEALEAEEPTLWRLRPPSSGKPIVDEAACRRLAEQARAIPAEQTVPPTVSEGTPTEAVPGLPLPAAFGPYLLLEQLGQGGMGVVYRARQESLKRLVAVKMVRAGIYATTPERLRFQREGEAIARIRHPHVVQIYEFGEQNGQLYFSMELLEGGTLTSKLNGQPLPEREAAELVRTLAQTVEAAHRQGVVHRDLKPGNVLFTAEGMAKITDFGLAKVLDSESSDTLSDAILGTPAYMAPEQARGEIRLIGPAADVYALGAILYEALTGQPPFRAKSRYQTLELVRTCEPQPPSRHRPSLARDLEAICLKCLEKQPASRYESAQALAEDLERWLTSRPTQARPLGWAGRGWRPVRRQARLIGAVCLLVALGLLFAAAAYFRSPERNRTSIERCLARGQAVTLLGERGEPLWSEWALHKAFAGSSEKDGGAFTITTMESDSILLLVRDPQGPYRFSAEVRHEPHASIGSRAGLCILYNRQNTSRGLNHCYATLTFNDFCASVPAAGGRPQQAVALLALRRAQDRDSYAESHLGGRRFTPSVLANPGQPVPWRKLELVVDPETIEAFWEGESFARVSRRDLLAGFESLKQQLVAGLPVNQFPDLHPSFTERDGLGLYVTYGKAAFRNIVVQPRR